VKQGCAMRWAIVLMGLCAAGCGIMQWSGAGGSGTTARRIKVDDYLDKLKGGWLGQMAGVGWGAGTEFKYKGVIVPQDSLSRWAPQMVNQFEHDALYVEMTFLRTLERYGLDVSARQAGIDLANTGFSLSHANCEARNNLRAGIAPPDSGHPHLNFHADDIDYQMESDFAGLIAPGMPAVAIQLNEKFGRIASYGDGLYGGQFIAGMYTEAFFEKNPARIVRAGLRCIPRESQYHECISDVLRWHAQNPDNWMKVWRLVDEKYRTNPAYRRFSCSDVNDPFDIDAKLNGAYVAMGLLYGEGDPDKTIMIAARCGQASSGNSSSAAGILFTSIGFRSLPERFKLALDPWGKFAGTSYSFPTVIDVCEDLARQAVVGCGGEVEADAEGREYLVIPAQKLRIEAVRQSWAAELPTRSRYPEKEVIAIAAPAPAGVTEAVARFAPGWQISGCGEQMTPGLYPTLRGRKSVLVTCPPNPIQGCVLSRRLPVPSGRATSLKLVVGHDPRGDWALVVTVNGEAVVQKSIGTEVTTLGWVEISVDLSQYAGRTVELQVLNLPTGWHYEAAYWAEISLSSV
jgi:hypothetical protein